MADNGILVNGLFLSSQTPKANQRGLLIDDKFFIPMVEAGGGSAEYYRCASVDTAAKTWTGYKAVLTDGVYAFDTTVTTGLTYTSVTPVVESIYSADALASVNSLWDGMPPNGRIYSALGIVGDIGTTVTTWGNFTAGSSLSATIAKSAHSNKNGVTSANTWTDANADSRFVAGTPSSAVPCTYAMSMDLTFNGNANTTVYRIMQGIFGQNQAGGAGLYIQGDGTIHASCTGSPEQIPTQPLTDGEHVVAVDYTSSTIKIYVDGVAVLSNSYSQNYYVYPVSMLPASGCVLFALSVYNRSLSSDEIAGITA